MWKPTIQLQSYPGDLWRHCGGLGKEILMPYPINQRAHQFNSIQSVPVSFGLWDTALKFLSPGPRSDVTDHLDTPYHLNREGTQKCSKQQPQGMKPVLLTTRNLFLLIQTIGLNLVSPYNNQSQSSPNTSMYVQFMIFNIIRIWPKAKFFKKIYGDLHPDIWA